MASTSRRARMLVVVLLGILLIGCGGGQRTLAPTPEASPSPRTSSAPDSLVEAWRAAARDEGPVRVYADVSSREQDELAALVDRRYPGLRVEWTRGHDEALLTRALAERSAGGGTWDVFVGERALALANEGMAATWTPPEGRAIRTELADPRGQYFAVALTYHLLEFNLEQVPFATRPTAYETLHEPRFDGRLAIGAGSLTWLKGMLEARGRQPTLDLLLPLASRAVATVRSPTELSAFIASGRYAVAIENELHAIEADRRGGAKVGWVPIEPVVVQPAAAVVAADAPRPNGARLVANLLLTADAAHALAGHGRVPARFDVDPDPSTPVRGLRTHLTLPPVGDEEQALRALHANLWSAR